MCAVTIFLSFLALFNCVLGAEPTIHQRYEYQFAFKGPLLVQKDGLIPFWEHGGHAIASEDKVRLVPSMRNKRGFMWSKKRTSFEGFEADFSFRISGRGKVGADGLAMWFVAEKSRKGPVFGVGDKWNGLGLFFDTYDNDGQLNNPIVTGIVNDGTKTYDHDVDGDGQSIGNCIRDFRNRPFPILVRVRYFEGELSVHINNGNTDAKIDLQPCFSVKNVKLPANGYFGLSAATGEIADDHDVISFEVHSLTKKTDEKTKAGVSDADREKFDKEFADHMAKMKKAQDEYEVEHKDDKKKKKGYKSQGDEGEDVRRLRQIWEEQSAIHSLVNGVSAKLDLLMSQLERLSKGGMSGGTGGGSIPGDVVRKEDLVDARDKMTSAISEVKHAMENIRGTGATGGEAHHEGGAGGSNFYELRQLSHELRDSIQTVRDDLRKIGEKVPSIGGSSFSSSSSSGCPTCLTTSVFVVVTFLNGILIIGAIFFKLSQENSAKKFY